jgi:hypothetical protein
LDSIITFRVDQIRQEPHIDLDTQESSVKNGTKVQVLWPFSASSILEGQECRFLQIAEDYTWLNPHLSLILDWFALAKAIQATNPERVKWRASDPTCPHWYDSESLGRLIAAYISHDNDTGRERLVREFVSEFRGLSGSTKQKFILDETGLARAPLSTLSANGSIDRIKVTY